MGSIDLSAGGDNAAKLRRLNKLPIFFFIGLAILFFCVIIWGLSQRGMLGGGGQPEQTEG